MSLLHTASQFGSIQTAELLLEKGADLSMQCAGGETALHFAAFQVLYAILNIIFSYLDGIIIGYRIICRAIQNLLN